MGGIRRQRKKIMTPGHPYDKIRIDQELPLVGEYGLRNKKELWKARTVLSKARQQARALLALPADVRKQRENELLFRLANLGVLPPGSDLDSVLALEVRTVLNRRLQTIVFRKGLASSPYQARQFIAHRHIAIERAVVTSPGRLIKINEEENIDYAPLSPMLEKSHPARPQAPPVSDEVPLEKKEVPKKEAPKPEVKPAKPVPKKEVEAPKPEVKPAKPVPKKEAPKPEVKPGKPVPKKEAPKPEVKPGKPVPKKEVEAPKPEVKPAKPVPKKEVEAPKPEVKAEPKPPAKPKVSKVDVSEIKGVGAKTAMLLKENGFDTVNKIASSSDEALSKVPGIGPATAKAMISEAKNILTKAKEKSK